MERTMFWWMLLLLAFCGVSGSPTAVPPADHESILNALRYAGLSSSAAALEDAINLGGFQVPPSATLLVPTNIAMEIVTASDVDELVAVFSYHTIEENLSFNTLTSVPLGTQIPSLLKNSTLLVTDNNPNSFHINDRELLAADLCSIQTVACYAVDTVFDRDAWGHADISIIFATPPTSDILPPAESPFSPPGLPATPVPVGAPLISPVGAPAGAPGSPPPTAGGPTTAFPPPGSPGSTPTVPSGPGASPPPPPGTVTGASTGVMESPSSFLTVAVLATLIAINVL